jgi:hypothetical protein
LFSEDAALNDALTHLRECALSRGFEVEAHGADGLLLILDVPHADGVRLLYRIIVSANGPYLCAREDTPARRLPEFCPERHIVADGSFCMYWAGEQSFAVTDAVTAGNWLSLLLNFLRLQRRAAKRRCWPNYETWAHGTDAARQQWRTERAAEKLGPELKAAVATRDLKAFRDTTGTLRVMMDGRPLFSVWKSPNRFDRSGHRLTYACEFGSGSNRKTSHGGRAKLLEEMALALVIWEEGEKRFWAFHQDRVCCGTIDNCPLQKNSGDENDNTV